MMTWIQRHICGTWIIWLTNVGIWMPFAFEKNCPHEFLHEKFTRAVAVCLLLIQGNMGNMDIIAVASRLPMSVNSTVVMAIGG